MTALERELRQAGYARIGTVLSPDECRDLRDLYRQTDRFRKRIVMAQYRFGLGEYQYFAYPLPPIVDHLRQEWYRRLAPIAQSWMGDAQEYPAELDAFLERCRQAGQTRPTPLLLRYGSGDYNCLHQDLYGPVAFPFQIVCGLSRPGIDYKGGELVLVEQQPRAQSKAQVIALGQGEAVAITTRYRPVQGVRGPYRVSVRHGVSPISEGERFTLGVIFHDAE